MDNGLIGLLGLARKAGMALPGEEPVSAAALAHKARLILTASDASEHTLRKIRRLGEAGNAPVLPCGLTKSELGGAVGRGSCAVLALTDVGFAAQAAKKLALSDPQHAQTAQALDHKAEKTNRRRKEQRAKEKARRAAGRKPWAPPPEGKT